MTNKKTFRTNVLNVQAILDRVSYCTDWNDKSYAMWILTFVTELWRHAAKARHNTPAGQRVLTRIAHHLGQLIQDPAFASQEEQKEQDRKRDRFIDALHRNRRFDRAIDESDRWDKEEGRKAVLGAYTDTQLANSFLRELVVEFGLLEQLKEFFPAAHTSFDEEDPTTVFTETHWPLWWKWAEPNFFNAPEATTRETSEVV